MPIISKSWTKSGLKIFKDFLKINVFRRILFCGEEKNLGLFVTLVQISHILEFYILEYSCRSTFEQCCYNIHITI